MAQQEREQRRTGVHAGDPQQAVKTGMCVAWRDNTFGFIRPDDRGPEVFIHFSVLAMEGFKALKPGDRVEFTMGERNGRPAVSWCRPLPQ